MEKKGKYTVTFTDLLEAAKGITEGKWNDKIIKQFTDMINIRSYAPLEEKAKYANLIVSKYLNVDMGILAFKGANLAVMNFFMGMLPLYGLIKDIPQEACTFENYDLIYPIFAPYLLEYCKEDYAMFEGLVRDSINLSNLETLVEGMRELDSSALEENLKASQDMLSTIRDNPDFMKALETITVMNDPFVNKVVEDIKIQAVLDAKKEDTAEVNQ